MGLPVVTTSSVGNPEAVQHGQTGLVVPERDEVQLAHAISRLLLDAGLRRRFGVAALRDMRARFDVRQLVKGLEAPYTRTAERGPLSASGEACLRTHEAEALDPA